MPDWVSFRFEGQVVGVWVGRQVVSPVGGAQSDVGFPPHQTPTLLEAKFAPNLKYTRISFVEHVETNTW